jgi:transglutaminase-like putative cysteine protease
MQATETVTPRRRRARTASPPAPWLRLLPEDGWLTLALLAIVVYTTIASIQSVTPAWAPGLQILTTTAAFGFLLGYLSVQQGRLPSWLVQVVALMAGVAVSFQQTTDAVVGGDRLALWSRVRVWFHTAVLLRANSNDNAVFLLFLAVLSFLLAYISVWLVIRTRRPWLAALANGVVLLINLNSTTDDKTLFFLVLYLLATLLLLVRFTLAENMRQWRARGLRFSPDLSWDFMQAGAIFAVIVLLAAYVLPTGPANQSITDYWNSPNNPWQALQSRLEAAFGGVAGKGAGAVNFFSSDLRLVGTVDLPNVTILRYTVPNDTYDDPTQYLVTRTLDSYNGMNSWSSSQTQGRPYDPNQSQPASSVSVATDTYDITLVTQPAGSPLFAPGSEAAGFSVPSVALQNIQTGAGTGWISPAPLTTGSRYLARGYVSTATREQLRAVPYPSQLSDGQRAALYPDAILGEYLNSTLPTSVPPDVLVTAQQWTKGTTNMYDAAEALENSLRTFTYTTRIQDAPPGVDAISWFLKQRAGFCTYFATTMAIMGRLLGMPTRIVEGFTAGKYDPQSNSFVVKGTQAHVWTQVYFGSYGWINFEPTSSFDRFPRATTGSTPAGPVTTPGAQGNGKSNSSQKARQHEQGGGGSSGAGGLAANPVLVGAGVGASLIIVLLLLAAVLASFWWRLLFRGLTPVTGAIARLTRLGAWAGAPPRRAQTSHEYADDLARVVPGQRALLQRLSDLYARERYGGGVTAESLQDVPQLYEQVRRSLVTVIAQRARSAPAAGLRLVRRRRRRLRERDSL